MIKKPVRLNVRIEEDLAIRITKLVNYLQVEEKNYTFSKFNRRALINEVERIEYIIKDL